MTLPDVVIVGGGVIGCALARLLAHAGVRVLVVDRSRPGAEASEAAAGMLAPLAEAGEAGPFLSLLRESRQRFPALAAALREESGIDVEYRQDGTLFLAFNDADEAELEERWRWQHAAGLPIERLAAAELLRLEPAISSTVRGGLRFPEDHQVVSGRLVRALWSSAARAGAEFRAEAAVRAVLHDGSRAAGVVLADGERVAAGAVVVATGSWSGMLENLPRPLPVFPVHGQLLALEALPPLFRHVIDSPRCYLVPRADGRIIAGTTVERIGFRKVVTPAGMLSILSGALEICAALAEMPITDSWSGLRPGTPDGLPILGRDPEVENLFYATGHFRNGVLLAPLTAEAVGELVRSGHSPIDLSPFGVERFDAAG